MRQDYPVGDNDNGQIVQISQAIRPVAVRGAGGYPVPSIDFLWMAALGGQIFVASDADQNDAVTGQTSFANTTPTFLLDVPAGTYAVPLFLNLSQTGSVAGGAIDVLVEFDVVKRYGSGGTAEKSLSTMKKSAKSTLYTGPTATAGYGMNIWRATIGQDVSPAEGAVQGPFWKPEFPIVLQGPASLLIYTYAGTTGPTWLWETGWCEFDQAAFDRYLGEYRPQ